MQLTRESGVIKIQFDWLYMTNSRTKLLPRIHINLSKFNFLYKHKRFVFIYELVNCTH